MKHPNDESPEYANYSHNGDTEHTRQVITLTKTLYERLRSEAMPQGAPRIKIGDVLQVYVDLVDLHVGQERLQAALDDTRATLAPSNSARKLAKKLAAMDPEERELLFKLASKK